MKSIRKLLLTLVLPAFVLLAASAASAQADGQLQFAQLNQLESRATDVVEVTIDGKLLDIAKRVMLKSNDADAKKAADAISGLKGIYVRVYKFANDNEYNPADIEQIRSQLNQPGWDRLANVRSRKNNQKVDVFARFAGDSATMNGLAIVVSEAKSVALVNVVGTIDIDALAELGGKLNIPKIDIERTSGGSDNNQPKLKNQ